MNTLDELVAQVAALTPAELQHLALTVVTAWYVDIPMNLLDPSKCLQPDDINLITEALAELGLVPPDPELN
jgi:hypothetical protein